MKNFIIFPVSFLSMFLLSHPVSAVILIWFTIGATLVFWLDDIEFVVDGNIAPKSQDDYNTELLVTFVPIVAVVGIICSLVSNDDARQEFMTWFRVRISNPVRSLIEKLNLQSPITWNND